MPPDQTLATGWALVFPPSYQLAPIVDCDQRLSEIGIWMIGLGWPSQKEIEHHKRLGVRAVRVRIVEDVNGA